jgi:hypothetical protein
VASVFKSDGDMKYTILYTDEHGKRRKKTSYSDKKRSDRPAMSLKEREREPRRAGRSQSRSIPRSWPAAVIGSSGGLD